MDLTREEKEIKKSAVKWIKNNESILIEKFTSDEQYLSQEEPVSYFMAGSFGAGKTEFSRRLAERFEELVLIDADAIREMCPNYEGDKAYVFNAASFVGQDKLQDYVLKNNKSFVFDSTFGNYDRAQENVDRSLSDGRPVEIYYVFQNPRTAWLFTKIREKQEGRYIPKEAFVDSFLQSWESVHKIKEEFKYYVKLNLVEKSTESKLDNVDLSDLDDKDLKDLEEEVTEKNVEVDIDSVEDFIEFDYSKSTLIKTL